MKFFSFEKPNTDEGEKNNSQEETLRSEFDAHKELHEGIAPEPVLDVMKKHHDEIEQSGMDVHKTRRLLSDEYQVLVRMGFSKEEIENELERRLLQLIPRKR
ncbi:MAG TPA: hypothetical protein ENI56_02405 [Candidatus Kaiserbacteria bacterium]|nr:hypothetical protein [Candidatus Kaiserbacteria bacterium]